MSQGPDYPFFAGLVNRVFCIELPVRIVDLRLESIDRLPPPRTIVRDGTEVPVTQALRQEPFTLFFRGPVDFYLPQAMYRMTLLDAAQAANSIEPLDIFIVPVGYGPAGYIYQAIFN